MADRFFRRGLSKILFAPAVADPANVTRTEMDAAEDLSEAIAAINGFQFSNSPIGTPNLASTFTSQIEGEDTVSDSSLDLYDDQTDDTIRLALAKGTDGFVLMLPYGDVESDRMEVWPAKSLGVNDEWSMGNDPARTQVPFAITAPPEQDATIPAPV